MDFGISKSINDTKAITKTGVKIGTILYMSPEQIRAQEPTNQSDIYSLGISFYEMLIGNTPFDHDSEYQIMEGHLKRNPYKLSSQFTDIPPKVDNIIGKALHKSLNSRYKSCEAFLSDVELLLDSLTSLPPEKKARKKDKTKEKTAEVIKKIPGNKRTIKSRIRFYAVTFFTICLFGFLFYFVYTTISQFWKNAELARGFGSGLNAGAAANYHWKVIAAPSQYSLNSICFVDDSTGFSCGAGGVIIKTTDGGNSWQSIGDSSGTDFYNVNFITKERGFIVGEKGVILSTIDGGKTFRKIDADTANTLFKITFLKNGYKGFIVGAHGTILKTDDGGITWLPVSSPSDELLYSIYFTDDNNGVIAGWNGTILKTSNQGKTWIEEKKISDTYLRDVCFDNENVGIIAGGSGEILRTDDGGNAWSKINSNSFSGFHSVFFSHDHTGFILGSKGEIFISKNLGKSWDGGNSGIFSSLTSITETPSGKIYISANNGSIISN